MHRMDLILNNLTLEVWAKNESDIFIDRIFPNLASKQDVEKHLSISAPKKVFATLHRAAEIIFYLLELHEKNSFVGRNIKFSGVEEYDYLVYRCALLEYPGPDEHIYSDPIDPTWIQYFEVFDDEDVALHHLLLSQLLNTLNTINF